MSPKRVGKFFYWDSPIRDQVLFLNHANASFSLATREGTISWSHWKSDADIYGSVTCTTIRKQARQGRRPQVKTRNSPGFLEIWDVQNSSILPTTREHKLYGENNTSRQSTPIRFDEHPLTRSLSRGLISQDLDREFVLEVSRFPPQTVFQTARAEHFPKMYEGPQAAYDWVSELLRLCWALTIPCDIKY